MAGEQPESLEYAEQERTKGRIGRGLWALVFGVRKSKQRGAVKRWENLEEPCFRSPAQ